MARFARSKMSKKSSRRNFKKKSKTHKLNVPVRFKRGGQRL